MTMLYEATVGCYLQMIGGLSGVLEKGAAYCRDKGVDPNTFADARLCADMAPLRFQIVSVTHHSRGAIEGVKSGEFRPTPSMPGLDYAGLQALLSDTEAALKTYSPAEFESLAGRDVTFKAGEMTLPFTGQDFLLSFSLPNFFFHVTTAYDILRANGVAIGKRDYIGQLKIKR